VPPKCHGRLDRYEHERSTAVHCFAILSLILSIAVQSMHSTKASPKKNFNWFNEPLMRASTRQQHKMLHIAIDPIRHQINITNEAGTDSRATARNIDQHIVLKSCTVSEPYPAAKTITSASIIVTKIITTRRPTTLGEYLVLFIGTSEPRDLNLQSLS
jgi:hypothetical protein